MRRLALPSAVVRSSKLGCRASPKGTFSISTHACRVPVSAARKTRADHAAADDGDVDLERGR